MLFENSKSEKADVSLFSATMETEDGGPKQTMTEASILDGPQVLAYLSSMLVSGHITLTSSQQGLNVQVDWGRKGGVDELQILFL